MSTREELLWLIRKIRTIKKAIGIDPQVGRNHSCAQHGNLRERIDGIDEELIERINQDDARLVMAGLKASLDCKTCMQPYHNLH